MAVFMPVVLVHSLTEKWVPPAPIFGLDYKSQDGMLVLGGGLLLALFGYLLLVKSVGSFHDADGTIAGDDPPKVLAVSGPYAYVRNPLVYACVFINVSAGILAGMYAIMYWAVLYWLVMWIYIACYEEPELLERFGAEYKSYSEGVGRWFPRCTPWEPLTTMMA
mgnify:CR=1 FL=1